MNYKYLIALILGFLLGILINIPSCHKINPEIVYVPQYDTITIEKERIILHTKTKYINKIDTFYILNLDTIYLNDIPMEYKVYQDTFKTDSTEAKLTVNYHGLYPEIDSIDLTYKYNKPVQTIIQLPKRVSTGFFIGPSIGYNAGIGPTGLLIYGPTVGINIGWGLTIRSK